MNEGIPQGRGYGRTSDGYRLTGSHKTCLAVDIGGSLVSATCLTIAY